jgi:hypothetical protein
MRTLTILLVTAILWPLHVFGQEKRRISAVRSADVIQIDGRLDEPCWQTCPITSDFTELKPMPGKLSENQTHVRVLYDDTGLYVGAVLHELQDQHIGKELLERDNLGDDKKIDWFAAIIDCYQNGLNGYGFVVSASGVQTDIKFSGNGDDSSWDAVWDSEISFQHGGWICEIKIPYSALRFPEEEIQQWGIQFGRRSYQRQDESFWNPVDPSVQGLLPQSGILEGIQNIKPPVRLSATPFLAVYAENFSQPGSNQRSAWGTSYNGGMDVKYGISEAYTMDMTLIPDFGQVQSDNEVLNLSPFEIQFSENRQFFTEGTELFSKASIFYSRRVGGSPYYLDQVYASLDEGERIDKIRLDSRLINATKISGRSSNGTGLGFFNAISPRDHAVIENVNTGEKRNELLQPWTNYNVVVVDHNLKNNSYVALINTHTWREGQATDANVTGIDFNLRDKNNRYGVYGSGAFSQRFHPDASDEGYRYNFGVQRVSGNVLWNAGFNLESDTYNPNDLGFIFNNNERSWFGNLTYNFYEPKGPFLNGGAGIYARTSGLFRFPGAEIGQFRPNLFTDGGIEVWTYARFKNYYYLNVWMYTQPTPGYDYFEPRVPGRFFTYPAFKNIGFNLNTDSRKKLTGGMNARINKFHEKTKHQFGHGFWTNYRINNHFSVGYDYQHLFMTLDRGFIALEGEDIIFGARDYKDLTQVVRLNYTFNPRMTLSFRLRHNWTRVHYTHFYNLLLNGGLEERAYDQDTDINFNAWTIDASFRWRFAPGSDMYIVWKNSIFGQNAESDIAFGENLRALFKQPQSNSFSVKAIYYLDFRQL